MLKRIQFIVDHLAMHQSVRAFVLHRDEIYEDMAEALDDGDPILNFLMLRHERSLASRSAVVKAYSHIISRMGGGSFTAALDSVAPSTDLMVLDAAERTGHLPEGLRFLADSIRQQRIMKKALSSALVQPVALLGIVLSIMLGFAAFLTPILVQVLPVDKWPLPGRIVHGLSHAMYAHIGLIVPLTMLTLVSFVYSLPRWTGRSRVWADRVLPWSVYRDFNGALLLVAFSGQVRHGVGVKEALMSLRVSATPWMAWQISTILRRLDRYPDQPGKAMGTGLFAPELALRIEDFARRSSFELALHKVGQSVIERTTTRVKFAAAVGNQLLLILAGTLLALMIVGTMLIGQAARTETMSITTQRHQMR